MLLFIKIVYGSCALGETCTSPGGILQLLHMESL